MHRGKLTFLPFGRAFSDLAKEASNVLQSDFRYLHCITRECDELQRDMHHG